jgi:hypothetical protein
VKSSKILGDKWEPMDISYKEDVKVSRDIYHYQVVITQSLIAILQNRIEKNS